MCRCVGGSKFDLSLWEHSLAMVCICTSKAEAVAVVLLQQGALLRWLVLQVEEGEGWVSRVSAGSEAISTKRNSSDLLIRPSYSPCILN